MMASSCRAESKPLLMVDSGTDRVYVMSGGGTLDSVLVSTTMSGWEIPIVAEEEKGRNAVCLKGVCGHILPSSRVTYIWMVCTQHTCRHGPVPLNPLPLLPPPPLGATGFSESGNTKDNIQQKPIAEHFMQLWFLPELSKKKKKGMLVVRQVSMQQLKRFTRQQWKLGVKPAEAGS